MSITDWIRDSPGRAAEAAGQPSLFFRCFLSPYTHFSLLARCQALRQRFV